MPKRLHLDSGDETWTAQVSGERVRLDDNDDIIAVTSVDGRLHARESGSEARGNAAVAGDVVWATAGGEVFVFETRRTARPDRRGGRDQSAFMPPMPATVVRIAVKPGDAVQDGDVLISLEAMKMELPIRSPRNGVVRVINCREGELVQPDQVLLELD